MFPFPFFFFKQKTAYDMRISDWSSDVCSSDLVIDCILPRRNLLYRSDATRSKQFASNIDQTLIVLAPEPDFSEDLTGRALTASWSAGVQPVLILNKADQIGRASCRERVCKSV